MGYYRDGKYVNDAEQQREINQMFNEESKHKELLALLTEINDKLDLLLVDKGMKQIPEEEKCASE